MPSGIRLQVKGVKELRRRFDALEDTHLILRDVAIDAIGEQKRRAPVKTGNLRRSVNLGRITARSAETLSRAKYSGYVEFGTRPHEIRPRKARALRWKTARGYAFATRVNHPGTRARPYMVPGAKAAISHHGLRDALIVRWNRAA